MSDQNSKIKVIVGMSGGVDSAVAAYLLKAAGLDVIGVTLKTWIGSQGEDSRCCEIDDAREAADKIGIPYYTVNCMEEFDSCVVKPFMDEYLCGRTPNPCVGCNRSVKWAGLFKAAKTFGAGFVATGHYAFIERTESGRYTVRTADHANKDQSYMLYRLSQEQLSHTLMPLGSYSKDEVRKIAESIGLSVASKPDSQEICFVPDGDYAGFIKDNYQGDIPGEGSFVDEDGKVLGRHKGIIHYTVGQRKGLGLAMGYPVFVKEIRPKTNEVVICEDAALFSREVLCKDLNFMSIDGLKEGEKLRCKAKIRYQHKAQEAHIESTDGETVRILFDEAVRAAAPGQSAVFYDEKGRVIGGGIIA